MSSLRILLVGLVFAAGPWGAHGANMSIGYLQLDDDRRYSEKRLFARYLTQPLGRPHAGAALAIREVKFVGAAIGVTFALERREVGDAAEMVAAIKEMNESGMHFFIVDAPADVVAEVARDTRGSDILLFNVSAREDALRQEQCQAHLLHPIPNYAMLTDALVQYLVFRKWRRVLVLQGPTAADGELGMAFGRSVKRYGARIVDSREFVLSNDPRERDQNNIALLTGGDEYDVVFVADSDGEFARNVPYQTQRPRPVVGTEGLAALAWHWSWERHGAPQLEKRFEKKHKRPMTGTDWAAWMAVKAVAEAVVRTGSDDFATVAAYLRGAEIILDGFKGNRSNFRPWDNQLRQPLLIANHNWVVARAPIRGFLHARNNMDTLGFDERDSQCKFD